MAWCYVRLLYGRVMCPHCGRQMAHVITDRAETSLEWICDLEAGGPGCGYRIVNSHPTHEQAETVTQILLL